MATEPKLLLIQLPFAQCNRPSIGLSLLRAALKRHGLPCDIRYENLKFAEEIGTYWYDYLSLGASTSLLLGDAVFGKALNGKRVDFQQVFADQPQPTLDPPTTEQLEALDRIALKSLTFIDRTIDSIDWGEYSAVGFTTMFQLVPSLAFAKRIKERVQDAPPVILGGSQCEGSIGEAIHRSFPWVNFVCRGEGERLVVAVMKHLSGKGPELTSIPGLIYRDDGKSIVNGVRAPAEIMEYLPVPEYHDWVTQLGARGPELTEMDLALPLETSRGCWWGQKSHCTFCGLNGQSMDYRSKSAERALNELEGLKSYDIPHIFAVDNILHHQYFKTLLPELASIDHGMTLFYEIKANVKKHELRLMRDAGIRIVQPGIESLHTQVLTRMRKGVKAFQNLQLLKWASEYRIALAWNLLYDFPGEAATQYEEITEMIPLLTHMQPPPGLSPIPVRLDRFSPMFHDREELGVQNIRPLPAYNHCYDLPAEELFELASYFQYDRSDSIDSEEYIPHVRDAVAAWQEEYGKVALVHFKDFENATTTVLDTRSTAIRQEYQLTSIERAVFAACDEAQTHRSLVTKIGVDDAEISTALSRLIDLRYLLEVDGRFLTLSVDVTKDGRQALPASIRNVVVLETYYANSSNLIRAWAL